MGGGVSYMSICLRACLTMNRTQISLGPLLLSVLHGFENLEQVLKDFAVVLKEQQGSMILVWQELWHHR